MLPNTIKASPKSKLGTTADTHTPYRIVKGHKSKRHAQCLFFNKSTVSTTFPPTRNRDISLLLMIQLQTLCNFQHVKRGKEFKYGLHNSLSIKYNGVSRTPVQKTQSTDSLLLKFPSHTTCSNRKRRISMLVQSTLILIQYSTTLNS